VAGTQEAHPKGGDQIRTEGRIRYFYHFVPGTLHLATVFVEPTTTTIVRSTHDDPGNDRAASTQGPLDEARPIDLGGLTEGPPPSTGRTAAAPRWCP